MSEICVVAHMRARKDTQEKMLAVLSGFVKPTRQEPGCIRYQLYRNGSDPQDFTFIEEWESEDVLEKHLQMPYLRSGLSALEDLVESAPVILRYRLVL